MVAAAVLVGLWLGWRHYLQPELALERLRWAMEDPTSPELSRSADALADLGPPALPPILDRIGNGAKGSYVLPSVLTRMGEPGHKALVSAIDREPDPLRRINYIDALVQVYGDLSRVNLWVECLSTKPGRRSMLLWDELRRRFGEEVPVLEGERSLNPEFLRWYDQHASPQGPLPPRNSSRTRPQLEKRAQRRSAPPAK